MYVISTLKQPFYLLTLFIGLTAGGCSTFPNIPVKGELAGQRIESTVDSQVAKYYLEHYLQGNRANPALDSLLDKFHQYKSDPLPDREYLKELSEKYSVDFAALYLAKRILDDRINQQIQTIYFQNLAETKHALEKERPQLLPVPSNYIVLFVPGWFYKSQPETGADFAKPRRLINQLGLETHFIETNENGSIEENAAFVSKEITRYNQLNKEIIMVSTSKAGPEVAQALGGLLEANAIRNVKAWINIGGILQGSLLADSALRWPKCWLARSIFFFKGWNFDGVESMATEKSRMRFSRLSLPKHVLVINYIGIPLSGDITEYGQGGYLDMRRWGPNDGLTLLTDEIVPEGITIAEIGLDHFFQDPEIDLKTVALAHTVIDALEFLNTEEVHQN